MTCGPRKFRSDCNEVQQPCFSFAHSIDARLVDAWRSKKVAGHRDVCVSFTSRVIHSSATLAPPRLSVEWRHLAGASAGSRIYFSSIYLCLPVVGPRRPRTNKAAACERASSRVYTYSCCGLRADSRTLGNQYSSASFRILAKRFIPVAQPPEFGFTRKFLAAPLS